ncbi:hypothetical protein M23134_03065 [Microscilla marina ATCC 23134]|uniref:Uncharacterized protein n=1 Tax=Microscilla marina ATCC 23134 TaxID=313606 RepID=A1ZG12_MICM2|nr:hypothetical protein M23134_03065 [Microscilla marina ATCC 23134]
MNKKRLPDQLGKRLTQRVLRYAFFGKKPKFNAYDDAVGLFF